MYDDLNIQAAQTRPETHHGAQPGTPDAVGSDTPPSQDAELAQTVLDRLRLPVLLLNEDSTIHSTNRAFCTLAQTTPGELQSTPLLAVAKRLFGTQESIRKLSRLLRHVPEKPIELDVASTVSTQRALKLTAQKIHLANRRWTLLTLEDISRQRQSDLRALRQREDLQTEIDHAAGQLTSTQGELRTLAAHLFTVQEEERQWVSRELHDDISQRLSLVEMGLEQIQCTGCSDSDLAALRALRQQVHTLNRDVRLLSHRLHPAILVDLGLPAALRALVREFSERENLPATYRQHGLPKNWPAEAAGAVYRIAQEALRNVSKHAGKTRVAVTLTGTRGLLCLRVSDFGVGFDQKQRRPSQGLGLISMQERARLAGGTLQVHSAPGQGTTVTVEIPLNPNG